MQERQQMTSRFLLGGSRDGCGQGYSTGGRPGIVTPGGKPGGTGGTGRWGPAGGGGYSGLPGITIGTEHSLLKSSGKTQHNMIAELYPMSQSHRSQYFSVILNKFELQTTQVY